MKTGLKFYLLKNTAFLLVSIIMLCEKHMHVLKQQIFGWDLLVTKKVTNKI